MYAGGSACDAVHIDHVHGSLRRRSVWRVTRYHGQSPRQGITMYRRLLTVCLLLALAACSSGQDASALASVSKEYMEPAPTASAPATAASVAVRQTLRSEERRVGNECD